MPKKTRQPECFIISDCNGNGSKVTNFGTGTKHPSWMGIYFNRENKISVGNVPLSHHLLQYSLPNQQVHQKQSTDA